MFLWDIFAFRLVAYLLNMTCLNLLFQYKTFDTVLHKFLETGTSDIIFMGRDQVLQ